jgi:hypothetical protein
VPINPPIKELQQTPGVYNIRKTPDSRLNASGKVQGFAFTSQFDYHAKNGELVGLWYTSGDAVGKFVYSEHAYDLQFSKVPSVSAALFFNRPGMHGHVWATDPFNDSFGKPILTPPNAKRHLVTALVIAGAAAGAYYGLEEFIAYAGEEGGVGLSEGVALSNGAGGVLAEEGGVGLSTGISITNTSIDVASALSTAKTAAGVALTGESLYKAATAPAPASKTQSSATSKLGGLLQLVSAPQTQPSEGQAPQSSNVALYLFGGLAALIAVMMFA